MSSITTTTRGGTCAICLEKFSSSDRQLTHIGGEGHDGFHEPCFKNWLTHNSICPLDRQAIDRNSLVSRIDLIRARLKPAMINAVWAACLGASIAAIGRVGKAADIKIATSLAIAKAPAIVIELVRPIGIMAAIAITTTTALAGAEVARAIGATSIIRAAAGTATAVAFARRVTAGTDLEGATGSSLTAVIGMLMLREMPNIGYGLTVGGCTPLIVGIFCRQYGLPLSTIGIPLIAGTTTGILSLLRGR